MMRNKSTNEKPPRFEFDFEFELPTFTQGIFRGLQDTQTPLAATLGSNALNVILCPILIFAAGWGVSGAALATVLSQLLPCAFLLTRLSKRLPGLARQLRWPPPSSPSRSASWEGEGEQGGKGEASGLWELFRPTGEKELS